MLESYKLFLRHVKLNSMGLKPEKDDLKYLINLKDEINIDINFYHNEADIYIIKDKMVLFTIRCRMVGHSSTLNVDIQENNFIGKIIHDSSFMKGSSYMFMRSYVLDYLEIEKQIRKIYMR
jgi:hypothetical protein